MNDFIFFFVLAFGVTQCKNLDLCTEDYTSALIWQEQLIADFKKTDEKYLEKNIKKKNASDSLSVSKTQLMKLFKVLL